MVDNENRDLFVAKDDRHLPGWSGAEAGGECGA